MKIQIAGSGCSKCARLYETVRAEAEALGIDFTIEKVHNINEILALGVLSTPALLLDGVLKASGRIPSSAEIQKWLKEK